MVRESAPRITPWENVMAMLRIAGQVPLGFFVKGEELTSRFRGCGG